ncbi:MAG: hypothetical protein HZB38_12820, partial [Planctomycetes bacterium]|nr:hypothetical protein [Planctomycetota bacterium]
MRSTKAISTRYTRIILVLLIAAAASAVLIGVQRGHRAPVEQTRLCPWSALPKGESAEYRIRYSATGRSEMNALFANAEPGSDEGPRSRTVATEVAGTVSFAAVAQGADSTIVALTISDPVIRLVIDDVASPELSRETAELIRGPTFIELDARGRVRQVW